MAILQPESLLNTRHTISLALSLCAHARTHTHICTQNVTENLQSLSSSLISVSGLKPPAGSSCYRTLNTSLETYVDVNGITVCASMFPFMLAFKAEVCPCSPPSPKQKALLIQACIHSKFSPKGQTSPSAHGDPSILMTVILITMRPLFQIFSHPSTPWFSVDLPGQQSQSHMINEFSRCVGFKRNDPTFFFFSPLLLIAFSQWRENVR